MSDKAASEAPVASPKPDTSSAPANEAGETLSAPAADAEVTTTTEEIKETAPETAAAAEQNPPEAATTDAENGEGQTDAAASSAAAANGSQDAPKKDNKKRKSSTGVPEHKNKKLNKKKSMPNLNLNVEPGEFWYARMKGHPPWPAVVCDEDMLPESLLSKRPVSAKNVDGTWRQDFAENGKNVKDRRYPVMFLSTNEFAWQVNTDLGKLDMDEVKEMVKNDDRGKKTKLLWDAFKVCAENHSLEYFKEMLRNHEEQVAAEAEAFQEQEEEKKKAAEKKAEKAEKAAKKEKRKSEAKVKSDEEEDVDMEDVADESEAALKKKSNKRKKADDSDGEPTKTPKTLKVNGPKEDSAVKPKKTPAKPKKSKAAKVESEGSETPQVEKTPETEAEKHEKLYKTVLYLRHKLQKGFLTRDQEPKEDEMDTMNEQFKQLEAVEGIDVDIIKRTKINKVLKAIIKLTSIPKDNTHKFKERSNVLLQGYNKTMGADGANGDGAEPAAEPATNGVNKDEAKSPAAAAPVADEPTTAKDPVSGDTVVIEAAPEPVEKVKPGNDAKDEGDTVMEDAKENAPAVAA